MKLTGEERLKETAGFSSRLKQLKDSKGLSITALAKLLGLSFSHTSSLINGMRAPSSDVLCSIAAAFPGISFADAVYMLVNEQNVKYDMEGYRNILVFRMNNGRGPTAGIIHKVTEQELIKYYGNEYKEGGFFYFLKRYLAEELYRGVFEDYLKSRPSNLEVFQLIQNKMASDSLFRDVIQRLYTVDEEGLLYVKEQTALYLKYVNKREN